jgi:hypothetical protein
MITYRYLKTVAPKSGRKYLVAVVRSWLGWFFALNVAVWISIWALGLDLNTAIKSALGIAIVVGILSYSQAANSVEEIMIDQKSEMLTTLFVASIVNSSFVYSAPRQSLNEAEIEGVFTRLRESVTENTRIRAYNDLYMWDFDEVLTLCLNKTRVQAVLVVEAL